MLELADNAIRIEEHYSQRVGHAEPMDIEWAKDADDGKLYIVQARPETVASQRSGTEFESYALTGSGKLLVSGKAVGEKIGTGVVRVIRDPDQLQEFRPGEVLVASSTSPDWEPVMKTACAIVTDHGGRTCHAAIVARELGVPAVVGTESATTTLRTGARVTVSCAGGEVGPVYDGRVPFEVTRVPNQRAHAAEHRNHGEPRQPRPGLPHRDDAERRRRPGAHGVHHQRAYRRASDGAGAARAE